MRDDKDCWFEHNNREKKSYASTVKPSEKQVFQEASGNALPPDQIMQMLKNLCMKVENMEKNFINLIN